MRYWRTLSIICNLRRLSGRNSRTRWSSPMSIGRLHASAFPAWRSKGIFMSKLEKKVWVFVEYRKQNKQKTWFCFLYSTNLCNRNSLVQGGLAQSIEKIIEMRSICILCVLAMRWPWVIYGWIVWEQGLSWHQASASATILAFKGIVTMIDNLCWLD